MSRALPYAALAVSFAALAIGIAALRKDAERLDELEKRLSAAEASKSPTPVHEKTPSNSAAADPGGTASPPTPGGTKPPAADDSRIAKLERSLTRIETRLAELNREAQTSIDAEIAGATADQIWEKVGLARRDRLMGKADALLKAFVERFPGDKRLADALLQLGAGALGSGDWSQAVPYYERILAEFPESSSAPYAEFYVAMAKVEGGDLAGGAAQYERAAEKLEADSYWQAAAYYNLGEAYEKAGQPEVAKAYYRKLTVKFEGDESAGDLAKQAAEKLKKLEGR